MRSFAPATVAGLFVLAASAGAHADTVVWSQTFAGGDSLNATITYDPTRSNAITSMTGTLNDGVYGTFSISSVASIAGASAPGAIYTWTAGAPYGTYANVTDSFLSADNTGNSYFLATSGYWDTFGVSFTITNTVAGTHGSLIGSTLANLEAGSTAGTFELYVAGNVANGTDPLFDVSSSTYTVTPGAVPIPASAWLLGSGLLGVVGISRRRRAA